MKLPKGQGRIVKHNLDYSSGIINILGMGRASSLLEVLICNLALL
jgi:hypothetical protein